jgi:NADPH:quinone reductase-like Zn-dependent oxidoreductase
MLGYSSAGVVLESCDGAPAAPGQLVACAGAGPASHAEVVSVPRTLCVRVPEKRSPRGRGLRDDGRDHAARGSAG